jgi:hypothetical protein
MILLGGMKMSYICPVFSFIGLKQPPLMKMEMNPFDVSHG